MQKTEWNADLRGEKIIGEFLDKNLYARIRATTGVIFDRVTDLQQQLQGIDVAIQKNGIYIDEKVQLDYINKNLPTNCFEISFIGPDGSEKQGWFVNKNLMTTHYLIVWPFADLQDANKQNLTYEKITKLQCILISKAKLLYFLNVKGFSSERMKAISDEMRHEKKTKVKYPNESFYFVHTLTKTEKPVNIVVKKDVLLALASHVYEVTKDKLITLTQEEVMRLIMQSRQIRKY